MTPKQQAYHEDCRGRPRGRYSNTGRFKCVYKARDHFVAKLRFCGVLYSLGSFVTDVEAARVVAAKRAELMEVHHARL